MRKTWCYFWLICLLLPPIAYAADAQEAVKPPKRGVALVIGNGNYTNLVALRNAVADARAIAKTLEDVGFDVKLAINANKEQMFGAVRTFKSLLKEGDEAVFFFSGHGVQLGESNYLLPTDTTNSNADQVRDTGLPLQRVLTDLKEQKTRFALAIVDACRDNPFTTPTGQTIGERGLAMTSPAVGQVLLYSAATGQRALDSLGDADKDPNSLFTRALLKEMVKPNVAIGQLLTSVRDEVMYLARSIGQEQVPALFDQADHKFYFTQERIVAPAAVGAAAAPVDLPNVPVSADDDFMRNLERIEQRNVSQAKWQAGMQAAFDKVSALNIPPQFIVAAWEQFLSNYAQDNPYSTEDEMLRAQAQERKQAAEQQVSGTAPTQPVVATPTPAAVLPVARPTPVAAPPILPVVAASPTLLATPIPATPVAVVVPPTPVAPATPPVAAPVPATPVAVVAPPTPVASITPPVVAPTVVAAVSPPSDAPAESSQTAMLTPPAPPPPVTTLQTIRDCPECPEMISLPTATFIMGSPATEVGRYANETQRSVTIQQPFAIGKYEVTFAEWDVCVAEKACAYRPDDEGWGRGNRPVIQVSWDDTQQYLQWLSQKTGKPYRLPTDEEWEYAARAGTTTTYPWGDQADHNHANYGIEQCCAAMVAEHDTWENTAPVGNFPPNTFGLYDIQGNVWEWMSDCSDAACTQRSVRGGSWNSDSSVLRSANRNEKNPSKRLTNYGFRVVRN